MTEDGVLYRPSGERQQLLVFPARRARKAVWKLALLGPIIYNKSYLCMNRTIACSTP